MRPKSATLTANELELMKIVWGHADGVTVRDIYEELRTRRPIAYTTVMTSMRTLEQKGYLKASQQDRAFVYKPAQPKQKVIKAMVREFVDRVFNGSSRPLVVHLLEDDQLSERDLQEIARMTGDERGSADVPRKKR
jgi:BlaI family transcriptional regulator, penicillinase repressor